MELFQNLKFKLTIYSYDLQETVMFELGNYLNVQILHPSYWEVYKTFEKDYEIERDSWVWKNTS